MNRSKDKKITLRLSEELYLKVEQQVEEKKIKMSTAIRRLIVMGLDENKLYLDVEPIIFELHEFSCDMARIGGNLNQLSHYFNMDDVVDDNELKLVHKALQVKFSEIARFLKALKRKLIDERDMSS